jgi:hypothetical protein
MVGSRWFAVIKWRLWNGRRTKDLLRGFGLTWQSACPVKMLHKLIKHPNPRHIIHARPCL